MLLEVQKRWYPVFIIFIVHPNLKSWINIGNKTSLLKSKALRGGDHAARTVQPGLLGCWEEGTETYTQNLEKYLILVCKFSGDISQANCQRFECPVHPCIVALQKPPFRSHALLCKPETCKFLPLLQFYIS